jgi:hypothetical protein
MIAIKSGNKMKSLTGNISILAVFLIMALPLHAQQPGQQQQ